MALSKCLQDYSQKAVKSETILNPSTYDRRKCGLSKKEITQQ